MDWASSCSRACCRHVAPVQRACKAPEKFDGGPSEIYVLGGCSPPLPKETDEIILPNSMERSCSRDRSAFMRPGAQGPREGRLAPECPCLRSRCDQQHSCRGVHWSLFSKMHEVLDLNAAAFKWCRAQCAKQHCWRCLKQLQKRQQHVLSSYFGERTLFSCASQSTSVWEFTSARELSAAGGSFSFRSACAFIPAQPYQKPSFVWWLPKKKSKGNHWCSRFACMLEVDPGTHPHGCGFVQLVGAVQFECFCPGFLGAQVHRPRLRAGRSCLGVPGATRKCTLGGLPGPGVQPGHAKHGATVYIYLYSPKSHVSWGHNKY